MTTRAAWLLLPLLAAACSSAPEATPEIPPAAAPPGPPAVAGTPVPPETWEDIAEAARRRPPQAPALPAPAAAPIQTGTGASVSAEFPPESTPSAAVYADLVRLMESICAGAPHSRSELLRLAVMHLLQGDYPRAQELLGRLPAEERDDWRTLTEAYVAHMLGEPVRAHERLDRVRDLWSRGGALAIEKAVLCTAVEGFNKYTPRPEGLFFPDRERRLLLYVELGNFVCKAEEGGYTIRLRWNWELLDSQGQVAPVPRWQRPEAERTGRFDYRGPVRDFYLWVQLDLPTNLAMGSYRVRLTLKDLHAQGPDAVAEVPFTVAGR